MNVRLKLSKDTAQRRLRVSIRHVARVVHHAMVTASNERLTLRLRNVGTPEQAAAMAQARVMLAKADTEIQRAIGEPRQ